MPDDKIPSDKLHWEDFKVGETLTYGSKTVTREEIIEFARQYDPQPFHIDEDAAAKSPFGGLIASGWQSNGFFMRMMVDHVLNRSTSMGSPGVKSLRWLKPVRPGDTLTVRHETLRKARHPRRAELGFVDNRLEMVNQHGEVVTRMESSGMFLLRHPEAPE
jgi:acyl dehydratase